MASTPTTWPLPAALTVAVGTLGDRDLSELDSAVRAELRRRKEARAEAVAGQDLEGLLRESLFVVRECP